MQQSNGYVILFTAIMTVVIGGVLALASEGLKEAQIKSIELDTKSQILGAVMDLGDEDDVLAIYDKRINSLVVDHKGNPLKDEVAEKVNILKQYKKLKKAQKFEAVAAKKEKDNDAAGAKEMMKKAEELKSDVALPVFKFHQEGDADNIEAFIMPVYGAGLWDKIWGYVALDNKLQVIKGVAFDHKAETPGLGARISDKEIQNRYKSKEIYNDSGELISVTMVKGENNSGLTDHQVDGMSGATMTAKGVNEMLKTYLGCYQPYFKTLKTGGGVAEALY